MQKPVNMNENTLPISRRELVNIIRQELSFLKEVYKTNDLVNRAEAIAILGVTPETFSVYISKGFVRIASTNPAGGDFFSRAELMGIKKFIITKQKSNENRKSKLTTIGGEPVR